MGRFGRGHKRSVAPEPTVQAADDSGPLGVLVLHLESASGLRSADKNGLSDPYVTAKVAGNKTWRSRTCFKTLDPNWYQTHEFPGYLADLVSQPLQLRVYDFDVLTFNDPLGHLSVPLDDLLKPSASRATASGLEQLNPMQSEVHFRDVALKGVPSGRITFSVSFKFKYVVGLLPGTPVHASAAQALRRPQPQDATWLERGRDRVILSLTHRYFLYFAVLWTTTLLSFGALVALCFAALYLPKMFDPNAPEAVERGSGEFVRNPGPMWLGMSDAELEYWANNCIQVLTGLFTYFNLICLPWRCSIASSSGREFDSHETVMSMLDAEIGAAQATVSTHEQAAAAAEVARAEQLEANDAAKAKNKMRLAALKVRIDSETDVKFEQTRYVAGLRERLKDDSLLTSIVDGADASEAVPLGERGVRLVGANNVWMAEWRAELERQLLEHAATYEREKAALERAEKETSVESKRLHEQLVATQHALAKLQDYEKGLDAKLAASPKKGTPQTPDLHRVNERDDMVALPQSPRAGTPPVAPPLPAALAQNITMTSDDGEHPMKTTPYAAAHRYLSSAEEAFEAARVIDEVMDARYNPDLPPRWNRNSSIRRSQSASSSPSPKGTSPGSVFGRVTSGMFS